MTGKKWLNIPLNKLAFTVYEGDKTVPRDTESYEIWKSLGVQESRIAFLGKDNFWIAGNQNLTSTEIFTGPAKKARPQNLILKMGDGLKSGMMFSCSIIRPKAVRSSP